MKKQTAGNTGATKQAMQVYEEVRREVTERENLRRHNMLQNVMQRQLLHAASDYEDPAPDFNENYDFSQHSMDADHSSTPEEILRSHPETHQAPKAPAGQLQKDFTKKNQEKH